MNNLNNEQKNDEFDQWMALYKKDPEAFEKMKLEMVQSVIKSAPRRMQHRLTGLQWRIDSEIKMAKTPLAGCIKVYQMMMESVYKEGGFLAAVKFSEIEIKKTASNIVNIKDRVKKSEAE